MKVILLQELRGKGGEGDVIEVATGYAVNYLLPKKIAIEASKGNLKQLELRRHNIAKREATRLDTAEKMLAALESKVLRIPAKVGEEGQLFGSVTTAQIAEALSALHEIEVDRKTVDSRETIKSVGEHTVEVSIYRTIKATVQILVVDENAVDEPEEDDAAEGEGVESEAGEAEAAEDATEVVEAAGESAAAEDAADATSEPAEQVEAEAEDAAAEDAADK